VDIGALMLGYGGGGHHAAGTCQIPHERTLTVLGEITEAVNRAREAAVNQSSLPVRRRR
jgi:nanoRNase/pAp phosphatase (c-di-AMP/oligoRNAs hydrolase)